MIGTIVSVLALWTPGKDPSGTDPVAVPTSLPAATPAAAAPSAAPGLSAPPSADGATTSGSAAPSAGTPEPPTVFNDVVQLDEKTGVDLDGGRAEKLYKQTASADLYLAWGYILYSSARHSAMYDDGYAGSEEGAYARCQTYHAAGKKTSVSRYIGGGSQQYCITTSEGRPGWIQAVNSTGDGGLILKAKVWQS